MLKPPVDEAFLASLVDEALSAYRALVPPDVLAVMREEMLLGLREHPVLESAARRAAPRTAPERSGDVPVQEAPPSQSAAKPLAGGRKR